MMMNFLKLNLLFSMFLVSVQGRKAPLGHRCVFPCARAMKTCVESCRQDHTEDSDGRFQCITSCRESLEDCREDCVNCLKPCNDEAEQCVEEAKASDIVHDIKECKKTLHECKAKLDCNIDPCTDHCAFEAKACFEGVREMEMEDTDKKGKKRAARSCLRKLKDCVKTADCSEV